MTDFTIKGVAYQSRMMDGDVQFMVLKRLLPMFTVLAGAAVPLNAAVAARSRIAKEATSGDVAADQEPPTPYAETELHRLLMPAAREAATLPDPDLNFILDACVAVTTRQVANGIGWVPVRQGGTIQHPDDRRFMTLLTIAWHVLGENFGDMLASMGLDMATLTKAAPPVLQ